MFRNVSLADFSESGGVEFDGYRRRRRSVGFGVCEGDGGGQGFGVLRTKEKARRDGFLGG